MKKCRFLGYYSLYLALACIIVCGSVYFHERIIRRFLRSSRNSQHRKLAKEEYETTMSVKDNNQTNGHCRYLVDKPGRCFLTVDFQGGIGNLMFQYAFLYSRARMFNCTMVIDNHKVLDNAFGFKPVANNTVIVIPRPGIPNSCFQRIEDEVDCAYDAKLDVRPTKDTRYYGYFQSWKYFKIYEKEIRQIFTFVPSIRETANRKVSDILSNYKGNTTSVLVGVHIRREDISLRPSFIKYGFRVASPEYVINAMSHFRNKYKSVIFMVSSNDKYWATNVMKGQKNVHFVSSDSGAADMATMSLANHSISTVGTFGWWIATLANGETVYYKHPFREGSLLEKEFGSDTRTYFVPGWMGME